MLLGLAVYTQCPDVDVGRVFLLFCLSFAVFAITIFDMLTDHRLSALWVANLPFIPATMLHLLLIFPERRQGIRRRPHLPGQ